jgi:uncharacterized protein YjbJ (UPF0337 family)
MFDRYTHHLDRYTHHLGWVLDKEGEMSATDKAKNKLDDLTGQAKEKFGEVTDDREKQNEGKADQVKSNLKDAGEKVKDAFRR